MTRVAARRDGSRAARFCEGGILRPLLSGRKRSRRGKGGGILCFFEQERCARSAPAGAYARDETGEGKAVPVFHATLFPEGKIVPLPPPCPSPAAGSQVQQQRAKVEIGGEGEPRQVRGEQQRGGTVAAPAAQQQRESTSAQSSSRSTNAARRSCAAKYSTGQRKLSASCAAYSRSAARHSAQCGGHASGRGFAESGSTEPSSRRGNRR